MNMISTGAFLPEMDASNKQETAAEKFARVWEKKNAKAARAGGVSLMALSLAACGGSSEEAAVVVEEEAEVEAPAVTTASVTATDGNDIFDADDFTTGADTITVAQANYGTEDVFVEPNTGDGDTMTITATGDVANTPTIVGIENIVVNAAAFLAGGDADISFDAARIANGTVTINVDQLGSGINSATVDNAGGITVVAGADIATLTVTEAAATSATVVDAGSATAVNLVGAAATSDLDLITNGAVTLDVATADSVNITATAASAITLNDTASGVDFATTSAGVTLIAATNLADFAGDTITGVVSVSGDAAAGDYTGVASTIIIADDGGAATGGTFEIADGANISLLDTNEVVTVTANDDESATTDNLIAVNLSLDVEDAVGVAAVAGDADASDDTVNTFNVTANEDQGGFAVTTLTGVDSTVNVSGAGDVTLTHTAGGAEELTVNAAAASGVLTVTTTATLTTVTGGSGADQITVGAGLESTVDGGTGNDTVFAADDGGATASDMTGATISGFELLTVNDAHGASFLASQLSGSTMIVTAGSDIVIGDAVGTTSVDLATIDLSTLTYADATDTVTVDLTRLGTNLAADQAFNYTGSDAADAVTGSANADTIDGGAGADTIDGGAGADAITGGAGIDTITGGAGADTIDLTEATAATDDVNVGTVTAAGTDVITGFTAGALADGGDTIGFAAAVNYVDATATDYDTGNATLTAAATAVAAAEGAAAAVDAIAFNYSDDMYVLITADNTYAEGADALVQLVGVDAADLVVGNFIA